MPVYTYLCEKHGPFDHYCSYDDRDIEKPCPKPMQSNGMERFTDQPVKLSLDTTSICGVACIRIAHRIAMHPDSMWSGHYAESLDKTFYSKSDYKNYLKNPERNGIGEINEGAYGDMKRPYAEEIATARSDKLDKVREQCVAEAIKEVRERRGL